MGVLNIVILIVHNVLRYVVRVIMYSEYYPECIALIVDTSNHNI